jgi:hypothetical protein
MGLRRSFRWRRGGTCQVDGVEVKCPIPIGCGLRGVVLIAGLRKRNGHRARGHFVHASSTLARFGLKVSSRGAVARAGPQVELIARLRLTREGDCGIEGRARQQAGGRLRGLLRLPAGRSRRASGGAQDDGGAGAPAARWAAALRPRPSAAIRAAAPIGPRSANRGTEGLVRGSSLNGRLLGLLRLLVGRSRGGPGGPRDDAGAGARGESGCYN